MKLDARTRLLASRQGILAADEQSKKWEAAVESFKNLVTSLNGKVGPADQLFKLWSKVFTLALNTEYTYDSAVKLTNLATSSIKSMRFGQPKTKAAVAAAKDVKKELARIKYRPAEGDKEALKRMIGIVESIVACMVRSAGLSENNTALLNKFKEKSGWSL